MSNQLKQWITDFDSGKTMESVSMGGMGLGYEIAIQSCAVETMRGLQELDVSEDRDEFKAAIETASNWAVEQLDKVHGFSGAQVGAANNIASVFWRQTPEKGIQMMRDQDPNRIIEIRKGENGSVEILTDLSEREK